MAGLLMFLAVVGALVILAHVWPLVLVWMVFHYWNKSRKCGAK